MAHSRTEFHELLQAIAPDVSVYFQPPENTDINYPCIIYKRDDVDVKHANNGPYNETKRYQVTVIARDPDSGIPDEVAKLPMCSFSTNFTADGLHHDVYQVFF